MLLWVSLLALASVSGQFATASKPMISLHPPWTTAFVGERVNLTCNGFPSNSPQETTWFHQYQWTKTSRVIPGNTYEVQESGKYRCQTQGSGQSDPVNLDFTSDDLILQAAPSVFEGDTVALRCREKPGSALSAKVMYKDGRYQQALRDGSDFHIHWAAQTHNGWYQCKARRKGYYSVASNEVRIQVLELFPPPVLRASPSQPKEGSPVTLTCETRLPPQRSDVQLRFCFFREGQVIGSGCSSSPELQIPAMWSEDAGSYSCRAQTVTVSVAKKSLNTHIPVQRAVARAQIHTRPPLESVFEGQELVLVCSVRGVSGPFSISWYRRPKLQDVATKIPFSPEAEFRISTVQSSDAGEYYCVASTSYLTFASRTVTIHVRVPVSCPVLTLMPPGAQALEGAEMTLRCEAQRGSLPILYQLFREDTLLQERKTNSWRAMSFRFSLTAKHSGNYYCTANNGLGAQRSEAVTISVKVPVSRPVLTLMLPGARALEGAELTLHCESQRGSLPILYEFFHEDALLKKVDATFWREGSFRLSLTAERSGNYHCTATNDFGHQRSEAVTLSVIVPVSRPVLTLRAPRDQALVGDTVELHCEVQRGSPPILYRFYLNDVTLGSSSAPSGGGASFNLSLTAEHSGNYSCEADNSLGVQRSTAVALSVKVPASRPVLTLRSPRVQAVMGDMLELHCEAQTGSPPILYRFYHDDVTLGSSSAPSGGGVSFSLSLTAEHSGNYSCEANNGLGAQRSELVPLSVTVPASPPILTLRAPGTQALVGDTVELHCEAQTGSPPILYRFYHDNVTLGSSSAPSGGGVSFNLSLTSEHSGNYSCEADNGLGAQRSEAVTLSITGLTGSRSGHVATSVTAVLLSLVGLAAVALLFYCWLPGRAGGRPACDTSRSPSGSDPQEPTYYNMPACLEMQPVYSNVNPKGGGDVVYSEVCSVQGRNKCAAAATPGLLEDKDSSVIYSQVKATSTPGSRPQRSGPSAPHR
ncbi:Fc receptor-like protein 5 isoform 2-T2 [Hipposideros larvatus]